MPALQGGKHSNSRHGAKQELSAYISSTGKRQSKGDSMVGGALETSRLPPVAHL